MIAKHLVVILSIALLGGLAAAASGAPDTSSGAARSASCAEDGSTGAPTGKPQFAGLLAGLPHRSACAIAGVDYRVGPPANQVFKRPGDKGALPAGVQYDAVNHRIRCDGTNGKVIDGIDLATEGGSIYITAGCNNLTIQNSRLRAFWAPHPTPGSCSFAIQQDNGNFGLTIRNTEIDGGGAKGSANCSPSPATTGETIYLRGEGPKILDYVYLHDVDQHFVSFSGPSQGNPTSSVSLRHSVITRCGFSQGVHCNGAQWTGAVTTSTNVEWNLFYDPQPDSPLGPTPAIFGTGSKANQVVVKFADTTQSSFRVGQSIVSDKLPPGTKVVATQDSGGRPVTTTIILSRKALSGGQGSIDSPDAYPVGLTIPIKYANDGDRSVLRNAILSHNTFYGPGPIKGATYAIYCSGTTGYFVAHDNWYSPADMAGLFNVAMANCSPGNRSGAGGMRTDTGAVAPLP
jgi:hypothetical protein